MRKVSLTGKVSRETRAAFYKLCERSDVTPSEALEAMALAAIARAGAGSVLDLKGFAELAPTAEPLASRTLELAELMRRRLDDVAFLVAAQFAEIAPERYAEAIARVEKARRPAAANANSGTASATPSPRVQGAV
ncbi:MAG: hypothetical protein K2Q06_12105 [Parvularculaceae bacterium]|nr:hypothetical protein [Parvularculaceae bacterium]